MLESNWLIHIQYLKKVLFLQLPVGTIPAGTAEQSPDGFSYLCVDGTKVPVREKACSWAARPWQGILAHHDVLAQLTPLREKIKQLAEAGKKHWKNSLIFYLSYYNIIIIFFIM